MIEVVKVSWRTLRNFLSEEGFKVLRSEYVDRLLKDIPRILWAPSLARETFQSHFSPSEAMEFFEANEIARPVTIRTNTSSPAAVT